MRLTRSILCAALTLTPATAHAADKLITFTVPLDIKSLNESVKSIVVGCHLTAIDPVTKKEDDYGNYSPKDFIDGQEEYGNWVEKSVVPDANGNYQGNVTMYWSKPFGSQPDLASAWCKISFGIAGASGDYDPKPATDATASDKVRAAPGAVFTPTTSVSLKK